jgi:hypothetical protein
MFIHNIINYIFISRQPYNIWFYPAMSRISQVSQSLCVFLKYSLSSKRYLLFGKVKVKVVSMLN